VNKSNEERLQALRRRAEALAQNHLSEESRGDKTLSPAQAQKTLHELRVHQIELEMQNEELRQAQLSLEHQRERYFNLYEMAPVGYVSVSAQGLILDANLTAIKLLGDSRKNLISRRFSQCIATQHQDSYYLRIKRLMEKRQTQNFELQMVAGQARPFWASLIASVVQTDGAEEIRIALSDISEHKRDELALEQSERALRISQEQMEIIQSISATGSWTYNLVSNEIWGSAEGMHIFGFPAVAGSLPIDRFQACIAEQDRQRAHQSLMGLINEGGKYDLEFTVIPHDGSPAKITHSVATLETDAQGKPLKVLGFVQDITKTRMMEERVRQLAFLDPLTSLPNRRLLLDRMGQALAANRRSESFGALIYLDLDNFKPLNDAHGHGAGDMLLLEVALRLNGCVRAVDTVSRIGGDEFVVLLGDLAAQQARAAEQANNLAEKIRVALARPYRLPGGIGSEAIEHRCSASIGVVLIEPQHQSVEGMLKWADAAMYRAKEEGRNRITFMVERRAQQRP
jgi:diguanylate cyclase (GGDEF)-like protein/PAS domain S-box-containing protein